MTGFKNTNTILIQGWMINDLQLKGNRLLIYALVYGFSQDGKSKFYGSLNYIKSAIGCNSKQTIVNILEDFESEGLLIKSNSEKMGVDSNSYQAIYKDFKSIGSPKNVPVQKMDEVVQKMDEGSPKNGLNNNIYNNNIYSEIEFLKNWSSARMHYDKKVTNISKLNSLEKIKFTQTLQDYKKEDIQNAMQGMFQQKEMFATTRVRPLHFLEHFEKYLDAFINKTQLYGSKKVVDRL